MSYDIVIVTLLLAIVGCVATTATHDTFPLRTNIVCGVEATPADTGWRAPEPETVLVLEKVQVIVLENAVVINVSTSTWDSLVELYPENVGSRTLEFIRRK